VSEEICLGATSVRVAAMSAERRVVVRHDDTTSSFDELCKASRHKLILTLGQVISQTTSKRYTTTVVRLAIKE